VTACDVLAIGETMAMVTPVAGGTLNGRSALVLHPGGAESNVAASLAQFGARTEWASAVGADALGDMILSEVASHGVGTSHVRRDAHAPTGVYFKDPKPDRTDVLYYRAGSAASAMGVNRLDAWIPLKPRLVHVSGITPALSATCEALIEAVVVERVFGDAVVSFDVNHRPQLWAEDAGPVLRKLAAHSDIVFVGRDEAERVWGTTDADSVRAMFPNVHHLVVKDGDIEAVSFTDGGRVAMPSRHVDVIDPVGAGDAFAAGWLMAHLRGETEPDKLALGHWTAAQVLRAAGDLAPLPDYTDALSAAIHASSPTLTMPAFDRES
jgi:2-dehydro-3-deoxygluconokinase